MIRRDAPETGSLRLLIVEDDGLIAMDLEALLLEMGHQISGVAPSVPRALSLIDRLLGAFDGAIVDVHLGDTSSAAIIDTLRADSIPYVLASGYTTNELRDMGLQGDVIRKPFTKSSLTQALRRLGCHVQPHRAE